MSNPSLKTVGGVVLCGGKSSRMGTPKYALPLGSETMLQRVLRILGEVVSPVVVVAASDQKLPALPDGILIARDQREGLGPMEGLAVGLSTLRPHADAAYVSSCDVPFLKPEFVQRMIASLEDYDLAIPRDGNQYHPLAAIYRTKLVETVHQFITTDRLRLIDLVEECNAGEIDVAELREVDANLDSLRNINTQEEYRAALKAARLEVETGR